MARRSEPLTAEHNNGEHQWVIQAHDDQPIAEGKTYAANLRVVLFRDGQQVREFTYPAYRIWTLLAHWTDGLAEFEEAQP